jgi:hypothetical protein
MTGSANIARGIAMFFFAVSLHADAKEKYSADPISFVIVDFDTGQPIEGALVVARWVGMRPSLHGPRDVGTVEMMEAVSSAGGEVRFPAWGPSTYTGDGVLTDEDPVIHIYKAGYWGARLDNSRFGGPNLDAHEKRKTGSHRVSIWSAESVRLKPYKQDLRLFVSVVYDSFISTLERIVRGSESTPCAYQKIPQAIGYMERERKAYLSTPDPPSHVRSIADVFLGNEEYFISKGCRSPRDVFKELGK